YGAPAVARYGSGADPGHSPGRGYDEGYGTAAAYDEDTEYGTVPGYGGDSRYGGAAGFPSRAGRQAATGAERSPVTGPQPALSSSRAPEETPPPWAGLIPDDQESPGNSASSRTGRAPWPDQDEPRGVARPADPDPAPAASRRGRGGQHAARHGKPPRRRRGGD